MRRTFLKCLAGLIALPWLPEKTITVHKTESTGLSTLGDLRSDVWGTSGPELTEQMLIDSIKASKWPST